MRPYCLFIIFGAVHANIYLAETVTNNGTHLVGTKNAEELVPLIGHGNYV